MTDMSRQWLILFLGMMIGGGLSFGAFRLRVPAAHPEQSQNRNGDTSPSETLDRAKERIAELSKLFKNVPS